jgi:hypothetical protein
VLGLKAEMDLIFTLLLLIIRDPNMVYIFPLYQPFINPSLQYSITPLLQGRDFQEILATFKLPCYWP